MKFFPKIIATVALIAATTVSAADVDLYNGGLLGTDYAEATTNKGTVSVNDINGVVLAWYLTQWSVASGHYADLKIFTNGTSKYDTGLDLTGASEVELKLQCQNDMNVEVFFGGEEDSSQNYLGDINCDYNVNTFTYDVSGLTTDLTDIQTGLWLHIPTWKNGAISQQYSLFMNIHKAIVKD